MFRAGHAHISGFSGTWLGAHEHCLATASEAICDRRRRRIWRSSCLATLRAVILSSMEQAERRQEKVEELWRGGQLHVGTVDRETRDRHRKSRFL